MSSGAAPRSHNRRHNQLNLQEKGSVASSRHEFNRTSYKRQNTSYMEDRHHSGRRKHHHDDRSYHHRHYENDRDSGRRMFAQHHSFADSHRHGHHRRTTNRYNHKGNDMKDAFYKRHDNRSNKGSFKTQKDRLYRRSRSRLSSFSSRGGRSLMSSSYSRGPPISSSFKHSKKFPSQHSSVVSNPNNNHENHG